MAKAPPPPPMPSFDRALVTKVTLAVIVAVALGVLWVKISAHNKVHQIKRRLEATTDPNFRERVAMLRQQVQKNLAAKDKAVAPVAVYVGQANYKEGKPIAGNEQPTRTLELTKVVRLDGKAGATDMDDKVTISVKSRPAVEPKLNEWWVVSVTRDSQSNNVLYAGVAWDRE